MIGALTAGFPIAGKPVADRLLNGSRIRAIGPVFQLKLDILFREIEAVHGMSFQPIGA
jgi:hypothetical protein